MSTSTIIWLLIGAAFFAGCGRQSNFKDIEQYDMNLITKDAIISIYSDIDIYINRYYVLFCYSV